MSLYDEQLQNHAIWASLSSVRELLDTTEELLADPDQTSVHARVRAIVELVAGRLDALDAQLVYFSALDNMQSNLDQVAAAMERFVSDPGNRTYLDQAETQASGILAYLAQLPSPTPTDVENLREIGSRYRQSMSGHIGQITKEYNELKEQVEALAAQVTQQEGEVSTEVERLTKVATDAETEFTTAETARQTKFETDLSTAVEAAVTKADAGAAKVRGEAEEKLGELTEKAEEVWKEIAALKQRAEDASNYLGINALAAGYHDTAEKEDGRAFWTRVGAIFFFILAIAASVFAVGYHVANPFSLEGVLTKALIAVPVLVLAGYLVRESSRHADRAHFNRQRQRQLESLPAYVDGLEPGNRAALYESLAPGFFSPVSGAGDKDGDATIDPTGALLQLLAREMKKRMDAEGA